MDFYDVLDQVLDLLKQRERVTYRAIKRQFGIDDDFIADLKEEIIDAQRVAIEEDGRILVWTGDQTSEPTPAPSLPDTKPDAAQVAEPEREPLSYTPPHLAEKILRSKPALEGERKQVTVLFCDLQNSTPLAEKIGPENMHALLNRFFELALSEVHRYEGTINQFLGDGFMAIMGAPIAHEDHARRAVLAAIGLQRTLKDTNPGEPYGVDCAFRIGINSGLVVVASIGDNLRMDYTAVGDTTNLASRLQSQSEPGEILVSETTARLVDGYIRLEALTPVEVKGKTEPVSVYKVIGTLPRRSPIVSRSERTLSQFVGRERELATLEELFAQVESGNGQVVGIVAAAGQGKSRLLYEFRQRLENKPVTYLEGRCLSYGSSIPYHPIIDIVRNNCGITETDSPEAIIEKVRVALREVDMEAEESAPYLLRLLGVQEGTEAIAMLTPEAIRNRTFETLREMSLKSSQRQPLVIEVEDLNWVDKTSEDSLASLVESLAGASILLLTTYRPGYQPPWLDKSYATQISLHNLTAQDALTIVHSAMQDQILPDHLAQTIIEKAEGNPFFLEELTRVFVEQGDLHSEMIVPDTVQGVLSARIDRLPEAHKRLLQTAAVLGREFSPRLLGEIWDSSDSLEPLLLDLKRLEFFFERTGANDPIYVFKHALTQDVAYESLLTTRRQALHAAAGQALEALYVERLEDAYDRLAYHYAKTDHTAKAVEYLTLVAERADENYALTEAVTARQEALVHAERLPVDIQHHCILGLAKRQADALHWLGRRQEALALLWQHEGRIEHVRDLSLTGPFYVWMGWIYTFLGEREAAVENLQRGLDETQRCHDKVNMGVAHGLLCLEDCFAGRLRQAVEHGRHAVALLDETTSRYWLGAAYLPLGMSYYYLGDLSQAVEALRQGQAITETTGDRRFHSEAAAYGGGYLATRGDWKAGIASSQYALECAPDAAGVALARGFLGSGYLEKGDLGKAIPLLEQAVQEAMRYRSQQVLTWFRLYLAEAYHADGQIERARDVMGQALALAQDIRYRWGIALAQRTLGRIAHTSGNFPEAGMHFHEALVTSDAIQARYELARTHLDLASLAHDQVNPDTATTHLSTAYAWFERLQIPKWAEKTEQLAQEYGVTLVEVELAD